MSYTAHIRTISRNSRYHARARTTWLSVRLIVKKMVSDSALWAYRDPSMRALYTQSMGRNSRCLISGLTPSSRNFSHNATNRTFVGGEAGNLARVAEGELSANLRVLAFLGRTVNAEHSLRFLYQRAQSFSVFERSSSSGDSSAC